jgi:1-acyl-sn-glycerol-3-phosphate acyltransferase
LTKRLVPFATRQQLKVTQTEVSGDDLGKLRKLRGRRCLLMPSHSGGFEPYIIAGLTHRIGEHCNYLAAMEVFERSPVMAWFLPRAGVYSIIRGTADRPSFKMTKELLAKGKCWLVIFPEGQTVWQNDTVMPFQQGVTQLAFYGLEEGVKAGGDPHLFCVPIAVKYVYLEDMTAEIEASLARLETRLFPSGGLEPLPVYERLRRVARAVLAANEKKYEVELADDMGLDDRLQYMKEYAVSRLERRLDIEPPAGEELLDRIRALFNKVDKIAVEDEAESEYVRELLWERQREATTLYDELWRVLHLVAIYDGYVRETLSVERFLDVLGIIEMEVFRTRRMWGPRKACVKVGDPVDLADYREAYRNDRRGTVLELTLGLEFSVRNMLGSLSADCQTVSSD